MLFIRKFTKKDTAACAVLMIDVYKKCNRSEATKEAIIDFENSLHPQKVESEVLYIKMNKEIFYVAVDGEKIIGIIRGTPERLSSLFIDPEYQKHGIGKKLTDRFIRAAGDAGATSISVRSSLLAVSFYEKCGFKKTTGMRQFQGMKMFPMKKILSHAVS